MADIKRGNWLRASNTGKDGLVPSMYAITFSTKCASSNTKHIIIITIIIIGVVVF